MSTANRLAEIEARAKAATEGPWAVWRKNGTYVFRGVFDPEREHDPGHRYGDAMNGIAQVQSHACAVGDAAFIAHARADVPWLLGVVRRYEAALRAAKREHAPDCGARRRVGGVMSMHPETGEVRTWTEADCRCDCGAADHNARIDAALSGNTQREETK